MSVRTVTPWTTALAVSLAVYAVAAWLAMWLCDDAYIAFRYSQNFARGLGLRYNVGVEPPVEGYTQLGWVLWMGVVEWLQWDVLFWSRFCTSACGALLLVWVARFAALRLEFGSVGAFATLLFFASAPSVAVWASGGLGTMPFALAIFVAFERLLGDPDRPRGGQALVPAVIAAILRADGLYWLGMIVGCGVLAGIWTRRPALLRQSLLCGAGIAVVTAAHFLWRYSYYDDWLPNTVRAKVGMSAASLDRGLHYLVTYWLTVPASLLILVAGVFFALRQKRPWISVAVCIVGGTFAYGVLVSGDFMPMGRFFLPAVPFLALLLGAMLQCVRRRGAAWALAALALLGSFPALLDFSYAPRALREEWSCRWGKEYHTEYGFWRAMIERQEYWVDLGRALAVHTTPDQSLVLGAIGAVGYYSGLIILDRHGLVDREVVRRWPVDPEELRLPGHDRKADYLFFADRNPTYRNAKVVYGPDGADPEKETRRGKTFHPITAEDGFPEGGYLILYH